MNHFQRNKLVRRDYNIKIVNFVIDFIKGGRKPSKMFKFNTKSKKSNSKFKKKFSKKNIIQKIFEYNSTIKKKIFKKSLKHFIYTINTNIL